MSETRRFEALTFSGVLDTSFRLYAQNFVKLVTLTVICSIPTLFFAVVQALTHASLLLVFINAIISIFTGSLLVGALTFAVSEIYMGRDFTVGAVLSRTMSMLGTLVGTQFQVGLWICLGFFCLIIPGVIWMFSYMLVVPVVALEGWSGSQAMQRSKELVNNQRGKAIGVFLVATLFSAILGGMVSGATTAMVGVGSQVPVLATQLVSCLVHPFFYVCVVLVYYDARIRKEGFDLEMLSAELAKT